MSSLIDDLSRDSPSCRREYVFATGDDDGLRLLQHLEIPHGVLQSWNLLVVQQVFRRAAVHSHSEPVSIGVTTPSAVAYHQS